jgi:hypothetical protein
MSSVQPTPAVDGSVQGGLEPRRRDIAIRRVQPLMSMPEGYVYPFSSG